MSARSSNVAALQRGEVSLYRQLDALLRERILEGGFGPGSRLPSEPGLCAFYGVSRATVRQALDRLERDGLVERVHGRGTFLRRPRGAEPPRRRRTAWAELIDAAAAAGGRFLRSGSSPAPESAASALGLAPDATAPFFIRVLSGPRQPRTALKRYIHPDHASLLTPELLESADFIAALGRRLGRAPRSRAKSGWSPSWPNPDSP